MLQVAAQLVKTVLAARQGHCGTGRLGGAAAVCAAAGPDVDRCMYQTTTKKIKGARAHMLFQYTFYKGLDVSQ